MTQRALWVIALRDLGRNRRRTLLTLAALALGLALLITTNGLIVGTLGDAMDNTVRLRTGHVQIRAASWDETKLSLLAADLLNRPEGLVAKAAALGGVQAASPVLLAAAILNTPGNTASVELVGLDPTSAVNQRVMSSVVAGQALSPDDREGVMLGQRLATDLGVGVGQNVDLAIIDGNGQPQEGPFVVRALFATEVNTYDDSVVLMPLSKAQAFTGVGDRASAVVLLLHDPAKAEAVAGELEGPGLTVVTWQQMNQVLLTAESTSASYYVIIYGIVILVVAAILVNTLLMAVFERTREIGILAALGLGRGQTLWLFLLQAIFLGVLGGVAGIGLGLVGVAYLSSHGIYIGDVSTAATGIALGTTMRAHFAPRNVVVLTAAMLLVTWLTSLYPAWYASRMEPAEALGRL